MRRNLEKFILKNYRRAIDRRDIQVYYQPVIRTSSRNLCGFEALVRWIDPEIGMLYPDEFIPVLEKAGLIHVIDSEVLRHVCERIRTAITFGETPVPVSVNLSRLDFFLCDIFSIADSIVSDYEIPHDNIRFEITESVMAEEMDLLKGIVENFRSAGYQIWMDDFGSAYSSLNALKEMDFDELKLDMRFLRPFNQRSTRIATAVIEMAKSLDIHTLAEGVETEEQFSFLRNIGCEKAQGYYFGKPMPYEEALAHLKEQGIRTEIPQDRQYYDEIGRVDLLSPAPFRTREEQDANTAARKFSSIPLMLAEFSGDYFKVLFYNMAFEKIASDSGMFPGVFKEELLCQPQPYYKLPDGIINLADSVKTGGSGRMLHIDREQYYEIQAYHVSRTRDRYCTLVRITNLTNDSKSENTGTLDESLRRIFTLFDRITLINYKEDSIRPLYMATREDLLSGRKGLSTLVEEFAEKYIFPADRENFLEAIRQQSKIQFNAESGWESVSKVFRTSLRGGQYGWKEYTLLKLDEARCLFLIRNVHNNLSYFIDQASETITGGGLYSPAQLWNSLVYSDLLRIFWKDYDRRFLGASKAFLDYYGFASVDEVLGKNDEDLGWHVHPDLYKNDEYRVIHEGITIHNMPGNCINEGENREIMASKTPLYDANGEIRGLIGYFFDKTLLMANDKRGPDSSRKDLLTGLLNSRGISEEAAAFRDEYYLRGTDFVRMHVSVNDFSEINDQYGYDFGDKVLGSLGKALKSAFGRTCTVGRFSGHRFVIIKQVDSRESAHKLRKKIKEVGRSIRKVEGVPLTLYLSVGYVLFSECQDLDEQGRICEVRLDADHDIIISAENGASHSAEIFRLFNDVPFAYSVYHVVRTGTGESGVIVGDERIHNTEIESVMAVDEEDAGTGSAQRLDAVVFYVNKKFEGIVDLPMKELLGHSVRKLFPYVEEEWIQNLGKAALDGENVEGCITEPLSGKQYRYTASQVICPGYCATTYMEI